MLEKKKIENLPIGLFGDFYSHELSFCLIENNDYKNLNNIFKSCNLKIKKIILKSLIEGSLISNGNPNLDTFFQIKINKDNSQLFYFENDSLKFEQKFDFGSDLVINDISKITSLKIETIKKILCNIKLQKKISDDEVVKKELFDNENYIKVKEKLIFDIAKARIQELSEVMVSKNINLLSLNKKESIFFLKINDQLHSRCFENEYLYYFSNNKNFKVRTLKSNTTEGIIRGANKIVNFGWKKEAIPVAHMKKSIIAKFFDILFS
jgi:cell division ATPase FtsA